MNERINDLIRQSYVTAQSPSGESHTYFSQEKFAELIVGECFVKLTPYLDDQFIDDIESELKEHFGVKE